MTGFEDKEASADRTFAYDFKSSYDGAIVRLFQYELGHIDSDINDSSDYDALVRARRHAAAIEASCYRLASACLDRIFTESTSVGRGNSSLRIESTCSSHARLRPPFHHAGRHSSSIGFDLAAFQGHIGANIEPCPWIDDTLGLPYFLWDIERGQTIETSGLAECPTYTAISHTWGRWQKTGAPVRVDGVSKWLIPENSIFDVRSLRIILRNLPVRTKYVWFDLLCIPQDRSEIALREISRQAAIFRGAQYAIAWLNMISDWKGLRSVIEWMCLEYLGSQHGKERGVQARIHRTSAFTAASGSTGLFEPYEEGSDLSDSVLRPSAWFTSLWTLQEVCLRPDMLLCSKDRELLTVGDCEPVPFDGLVALLDPILETAGGQALISDVEAAASYSFESEDLEISASEKLGALIRGGRYPVGFIELFALLEKTGMTEFHAINQEAIMKLGSLRHCKEGRAEAIMSVIGATNWFVKAIESGRLDDLERSLILGLYPASFLKEIVDMLGSHFYDSVLVRNDVGVDFSTESPVRGSLLPFRPSSNIEQVSEEIILPRSRLAGDDHPSVRLWTIELDGSVRIPEAAVLQPRTGGEVKPLVAFTTIAYPAEFGPYGSHEPGWRHGQRKRSIELREWERDWLSYSRNHAVALKSATLLGRHYVQGVLLKETLSGTLVKVGVFTTKGLFPHEGDLTQIFQNVPVDWRVL